MTMKVTNSAANLAEVVAGKRLIKVGFLTDFFEQASMRGKLKKQVDFIMIMEEAIKPQYVWMITIHLNFDFLN